MAVQDSSTGVTGLHVLANDGNDTSRVAFSASGQAHQWGTAVTPTGAAVNGLVYSPVGTAVKYLYRENVDYGHAAVKAIRQATIKKVMACNIHVRGTSASLTVGNAWFAWAQTNASAAGAGSTLRVYGWRGASGISAATRVASIGVFMLGV